MLNSLGLKWFRRILLRFLRTFQFSCPVWCRGVGFIWLDIYKHRGYWFHGSFRDISEWEEYTRLVRKGDFILEIGAHIGFLTRRYSSLVGPAGSVLAIEPCCENFSFLKKNTEKHSNIRIVNVACGSSDGTVEFFLDPFGGFCNSVNLEFFKEKIVGLRESLSDYSAVETKKWVECRSIDSLLEEVQMQPDVIKIDTEGFELSVLKGASKALDRARVVMVEVSCNVPEVHALMESAGFSTNHTRLDLTKNSDCQPVGNVFFLKDAVKIND